MLQLRRGTRGSYKLVTVAAAAAEINRIDHLIHRCLRRALVGIDHPSRDGHAFHRNQRLQFPGLYRRQRRPVLAEMTFFPRTSLGVILLALPKRKRP